MLDDEVNTEAWVFDCQDFLAQQAAERFGRVPDATMGK